MSSVFNSFFGSPLGGSAGEPGTGNATVPGGTVPPDPQTFVDQAVLVSSGSVGLVLNENADSGTNVNFSNTRLDKLLCNVQTLTVSNFIFTLCGLLTDAKFPLLQSIGATKQLVLSQTGISELDVPLLESIDLNAFLAATGCNLLTTFTAPSLATIAGTVDLQNCATLASFSAPSLSALTGKVLAQNCSLSVLELPSLLTFTGELHINNNSVSAFGFGASWTSFAGKLSANGNPITGLPFANLVTLSGTINANGCAIIDPGFASLTTITGILNLGGNPDAASLGLPALTTCSGSLYLAGFSANNPLVDLSDLAGVNFSGGYLDASNMGLTAHGLNSITTLNFDLDLSQNALSDANAFSDLVTIQVSKTLNLAGNLFATISMPALVNLYGVLSLDNEPELLTFAVPNLAVFGASASLFLSGSAGLTDCSMPVLEVLEGNLMLPGCNLNMQLLQAVYGSLENSGGSVSAVDFAALTTITGSVNLAGNSVETLEFPALFEVSGALLLNNAGNSSLAFPALSTVDGFIDIGGTVLSSGVISFPTLISVSGTLELSGSTVGDASFPALQSLDGLLSFAGSALNVLTFGAITTLNGELRLTNLGMDQAGIDTLIANLAATLTGGSGYIDFSGWANGDPALAPDMSALTSVISVSY